MRTHLNHPKSSLMKYGIREIVDVAQKLGELDPEFRFIGENIGDPVAKGWPVPEFVKKILTDEINREGDQAFAYSHSRGNPAVRKWVVQHMKKFCPSSNLDYEDVLFCNGLGAGISALYHVLKPGTRILQPTPGYPAHTSSESFAAGSEPLMYRLDPNKEWQPDLEHMESLVRQHPEVGGILLINPNNPTGSVYSGELLEESIRIAEKHNLMILSDEIYFRMVYNGKTFTHITEMAVNRVPLIVLRGMSKDVPWPGSRCGWMEFHNVHLDMDFRNYCNSVKKRGLLEVCSTTLPQLVLPRIYDHPEYPGWNQKSNEELEKNGNTIADILSRTPGLRVNRTNAAFYMTPLFEEGILNPRQNLPIKNSAARAYIEEMVAAPGIALDKRFAYYVLASTGICVVPATDLFSPFPGFRLTTLDRNEERRKNTYATLSAAVEQYLKSA